jgi:hypothetical protein
MRVRDSLTGSGRLRSRSDLFRVPPLMKLYLAAEDLSDGSAQLCPAALGIVSVSLLEDVAKC